MKDLQTVEREKRAKLIAEKPQVFEKIKKIEERYKQGIATPIIDIAYSYKCNLKCNHCTASRFERKKHHLTPKFLLKFSEDAHKLGLCQFCISGGEPLLFDDLDDIIKALQPDKFHLTMSSNGHFLTSDKAKHLKGIGLDKIKISLDDFNRDMHDGNRNNPGAYNKAIDAMMNAKNAGMSVVIQTVVTHQNCQSKQLFEMAEFAEKNDFSIDLLIARATGKWEGNYNVLITEEDAEYLKKAHEIHPVLHRDTFPAYGMDKGCGCVDSTLHMTPHGDILPCVFIHISIGNIFEESLSDIIDRGQHIKCFKKYSKLCLSGEDRGFIDKYMSKFYRKPLPIHWTEAFSEEDFIK